MFSTERTRVKMFTKKKLNHFMVPGARNLGRGRRKWWNRVILQWPSFPKRVCFYLYVCVSAYDSKFDNVLLLLACSVFDDDHNPPNCHVDNFTSFRWTARSMHLLDCDFWTRWKGLNFCYMLYTVWMWFNGNRRITPDQGGQIHSRPNTTREIVQATLRQRIGTIRIFPSRLWAVDNE